MFILTSDGSSIAGFYTLSGHSLLAADLPERENKKLPRFPLPATLLGRMGVSQKLKGQGLGELLLMHALERAWIGSREVASWAVVVDAKADVRDFYLKYDFIALASQPFRLFLPMVSIEKIFAA